MKTIISNLGQSLDVLSKTNLYCNRDHVRVGKLYSELKRDPSFMETCQEI